MVCGNRSPGARARAVKVPRGRKDERKSARRKAQARGALAGRALASATGTLARAAARRPMHLR
jgi:hypothetical protein